MLQKDIIIRASSLELKDYLLMVEDLNSNEIEIGYCVGEFFSISIIRHEHLKGIF